MVIAARFTAVTLMLPETFSVSDWIRLQKEPGHEERASEAPPFRAGSNHPKSAPTRARAVARIMMRGSVSGRRGRSGGRADNIDRPRGDENGVA